MASVLLDTNVFVLLIVGLTDKNLINRHKNTSHFKPKDFQLILKQLEPFDEFWLTSQIIAETSNLLAQIGEPNRTKIFATFKVFVEHVRTKEARYESRQLVADPQFIELGIADVSFLQKSDQVDCSITEDSKLYGFVSKKHPNTTINFNLLRTYYS